MVIKLAGLSCWGSGSGAAAPLLGLLVRYSKWHRLIPENIMIQLDWTAEKDSESMLHCLARGVGRG